MSNELVSVLCKQGKLQVLEEGVLRVLAPFNKIVWQVPCADVTKFTTQPGSLGSVNITVETTQGTFTAETVTKQNFAKVEALFSHLQTNAIAGKEWYYDPHALTHIEAYKDMKKMQRDVEAAAHNGWIPQNTAASLNNGSAVAGFFYGPAGRNVTRKKETTITFVRTPEWPISNVRDTRGKIAILLSASCFSLVPGLSPRRSDPYPAISIAKRSVISRRMVP